MSDKNAWDDSFLQDSWNDAVAEYEVDYASILIIIGLPGFRSTIASPNPASGSKMS